MYIVDCGERKDSSKWKRVWKQTRITLDLILWRRKLSTGAVILSSSCRTLTKHLQETMLLASFPLPVLLMQLAHHASTPLCFCVLHNHPLTPDRASVCFYFFLSWQDYLLSREVSQDAPILVFACVHHRHSLYSLLLTYLEQQTSLSVLPQSLSLLSLAVSIMPDRCFYAQTSIKRFNALTSVPMFLASVFIPESMHICVSIQLVWAPSSILHALAGVTVVQTGE